MPTSLPTSPPPSFSPLPPPTNGDTLLSPRKAALLAQESTSWTQVTSRLTALFSPLPVPPFERNAATLTALLSLLQANQAADTERRLVHDALAEGLEMRGNVPRSSSEAASVNQGEEAAFLSSLTASLPPSAQTALADLASAAVLLGCHCHSDNTNPTMPLETEMSTLIRSLIASVFSAEASLLRLQHTIRAFEREGAQVQESLARSQKSTDAETSEIEAMQAHTAVMNRESKVVGMKLVEYQDRIKALGGFDIGKITFEDVVRREERVGELQVGIRRLEERILNMQGLPPDLAVSRKEVERARGELEEWKRRRERAFERLVE